MDDRSSSCRVSPFRNLRVVGYLLLTAAYRSLSRLSSALSAKASTLCSLLLDLHHFIALIWWSFKMLYISIRVYLYTLGLFFSDVLIITHSFEWCWLRYIFLGKYIIICMRFSRYSADITLQWRRRDSNSRPPACKAGALPTELRPHRANVNKKIGLSGLEPPTSRLSGVRSNRLSYKPISNLAATYSPIPSPV